MIYPQWSSASEEALLRDRLHSQVWQVRTALDALCTAGPDESLSELAVRVANHVGRLVAVTGRLDGLRVGVELSGSEESA